MKIFKYKVKYPKEGNNKLVIHTYKGTKVLSGLREIIEYQKNYKG